jgi:hypothetical protein
MLRSRRIVTAAAAVLALTAATVIVRSAVAVPHAQTIPEMAKSNPSQLITRAMLIDVEPSTLEELMSGAALVLEATVSDGKSYLSPDEQYVFTDYQLVPLRVFAGGVAPGQSVPGPSPSLTLATYGGDLVVDGVKVSGWNYAMAPLHGGGRYLLFLVPFGPDGKFELCRAGAFEINGQRLKSIVTRDSRHVFGEILTAPFDDTVSRIRTLAASRSARQ